MAILYRIRHGSGDAAIASSEIVDVAKVVARFPNVQAKCSPVMPVIGSGPSNAVAEPVAVVVQIVASDSPIAPFVKVGYFLLDGVHPRDTGDWAK